MLDAARTKARRGELRISVPTGYVWHWEAGPGVDPDLRLVVDGNKALTPASMCTVAERRLLIDGQPPPRVPKHKMTA